jgi:hypothetical protein
MQTLGNGDAFIGWGQQPYFSEYNRAGKQIFDAHFPDATASYRAYRQSWHASPPLSELRAVISRSSAGDDSMYVSWNGATDVVAWRLLSGQTPTSLSPVATVRSAGFETSIPLDGKMPYYAVQGLNGSGHVLGTSQAVPTPAG